jgi:hypothetical protein
LVIQPVPGASNSCLAFTKKSMKLKIRKFWRE